MRFRSVLLLLIPAFFVLSLLFSGCKVNHTTSMIRDIYVGQQGAFNTYRFHAIGYEGALYFSASDPVNGAELRRYDGNQVEMIELNPEGSSNPEHFVIFRGDLNFFTGSENPGVGLWKYDDKLEHQTGLYIRSSFPDTYVKANGELYFVAQDEEYGQEPRKFDGKNTSVIDIRPGEKGSSPYWIYQYRDKAVFSAQDDNYGRELWIYSSSGDQLEVIDLYSGPESGSPAFFTDYEDRLVFSATGVDEGRELFVYDENGIEVIDIIPGKKGTGPFYFNEYDGLLCFVAGDSIHGRELWKYDGKSAEMIADINPGPGDGTPRRDYRNSLKTRVYNGELYFMADDGIHGMELWKYDGKSVSMIADINPGKNSSEPEWLTVFDNTLYFTASDSLHGKELWQYDGKKVRLMKDIREGKEDSMPYFLMIYENKLYFTADDGIHGRELWMVSRTKE